MTMVAKSRLAVTKGERGPICDFCGALMTFGESMVIDARYACAACYAQETGCESSTDSRENPGLEMS